MERDKRNLIIGRAGWVWFGLCAIYMVARTIWGDVAWGVLSAFRQGAAWVLLLVCSLFAAVFHRLGKRQETACEHPVTRSGQYAWFCRISPFLGGTGGALAGLLGPKAADWPAWAAGGTVLVVGLSRLVATPLLYAAEMLLPASRRHLKARIAAAKAQRREAQLAKERILAEIEADAQRTVEEWNAILRPRASELARMTITGPAALEAYRGRIVDIGIEAWQLGRVACMRHLHTMAIEAAKEEASDPRSIEFIAPCWEGIGHW